MKILIAGATGMVGKALVAHLTPLHDIIVLGRSERKCLAAFPDLLNVTWDDLDLDFINQFDIVINLSGENIGAGRWNKNRKLEVMNSRVNTTEKLAELCALTQSKKIRLLNASAIGVYGIKPAIQDQVNTVYDESSKLPTNPTDFLCEVGHAWEKATRAMTDAKKKCTLMRFAVVLDPSDGALAKMLPAFKLGLGGAIGSGEQPFSWVSLADLIEAIHFLIDHPKITGPVNIVAPECPSQKEFAQSLAAALHRPAIFKLPAFMVKLQFGQMGEECLLNGVSVKSTVLEKAGFSFKYQKMSDYVNTLKTKRGAK